MEEYTIKVTTVTNDYYVVYADTVEDAYSLILDSILNEEDIDIIDSISYVTEISCENYDSNI